MSDLRFTGRMDSDAAARRTSEDQYTLHLRVALPGGQTGKAITLRAVKRFGAGPAAGIACSNRAHHLRRGVRVVLEGSGLSWCRGVAVLEGVDFLDTPDLKTTRGSTE